MLLRCSTLSSSARRPAGARAAAPALHSRLASPSWVARAGNAAQQHIPTPAVPVSDTTVPEGHKGLHNDLYGSGGAEVQHESAGYDFRPGEDDGTVLLPVHDYLASRDGEKPLGVYALFDEKKNVQYVGYSRNIVLAIKTHAARVGHELCAFVRPMVFANQAMATRSNLEREVASQVAAFGTIPPGNGAERNRWEGVKPTAVMSAAERAEYEEKKLKMQKAMGEKLQAEEGETEDTAQRRLNMISALTNDDWSAVIDKQTAATLPAGARATGSTASAGSVGSMGSMDSGGSMGSTDRPLSSPFARADVHRTIGDKKRDSSSGKPAAPAPEPAMPDMTIDSVHTALDEVRPYLMADGGDVEVVAVEAGNILLRLQGACSSCPSSSATMSMGIERALRARFGSQLKDVIQVDKMDTIAPSVQNVDNHLNMLRGAVANFGGSVEVISVEGPKCTLKYKGPKPIGLGIQAAIKDTFPTIKEVVMLPVD